MTPAHTPQPVDHCDEWTSILSAPELLAAMGALSTATGVLHAMGDRGDLVAMECAAELRAARAILWGCTLRERRVAGQRVEVVV